MCTCTSTSCLTRYLFIAFQEKYLWDSYEYFDRFILLSSEEEIDVMERAAGDLESKLKQLRQSSEKEIAGDYIMSSHISHIKNVLLLLLLTVKTF